MKKQDRILQAIAENKELQENFKKVSGYDNKEFYNDAQRYIKAIKEGRMCCVIEPVSRSGMSRNIKFLECSIGKRSYCYLNFKAFFKVLGYKKSLSDADCFTVSGYGLDLINNTNNMILYRLTQIGFITKKECDMLSQKTPTTL